MGSVTVRTRERTAPRRLRSLPQSRSAEGLGTLGLYLAAGVSYVAVGVFVTEVFRSWIVGFGWLLVWVWLLPSLARRLLR